MEQQNNLPEPPELQPVRPERYPAFPFDIAVLVDNIVYQVYNVEGEQAALFLSQPTFVQYKNDEAKVGWKYDPETKTFKQPIYDPETDTFSY
jgi:hypothetical protein